jgi:ureidoglycolate hydrolase
MHSPAAPTALLATPITPANFAPYGQVVGASADGKRYDTDDAQLSLDQGIPRFYIMRLTERGTWFTRITRHQRCTQCLGALGGKDWLMAVAPPGVADKPELEQLQAFWIPGDCFIKLHVGTWHAGPYFEHEWVDFYNLELSDTNLVDHETCNLQATYGQVFVIER